MKTLLNTFKIVMLTIVLAFSVHIKAQVPPSNLSGTELRNWLKTNYHTGKHNQLGYTNARKYLYNNIDNYNNQIVCVYSGYVKSWTYGGTGTNPSPINCEHTVPQSFFSEAEPMKSDLHHLFPTYSNWNSTRSNHPFAEIADNQTEKWMYNTTSLTTIPTSNINLYSEYYNSKFEPREDHKGNCARAIFYFYTMYPTQAGSIGSVADINTLYQWHLSDPVDSREQERNNRIQTYQGDRNPYIDYPEAVAAAWGFSTPTPSVPSAPVIALSASTTSLTITWADVTNETGYKLYKKTGTGSFTLLATLNANATSYIDNAVVAGTSYSYYNVAYNTNGNSVNSNTVTGQLTTTPPPTGSYATDLIISEYIEGSSYNKAIEIANFTGVTVNLASYSLQKQTNGAGSWNSALTLSGTLAHGQVYLVVNSSATSTLLSKANLSTTSACITFNGNDAVGLFKNGTLIDIVGTINGGSANFAADVTKVRSASVTSPSATYNTAQWTNYGVDVFTYAGSHTMSSGTVAIPSVPTGLATGSITTSGALLSWTSVSGATSYDVRYKTVSGSNWTTINTSLVSYTVSGLTAATLYEFQVSAKNSAGSSAFSTSKQFTTSSSTVTYCTSKGNSVADEWIKQVVCGTINNTSNSNGGYANFTSLKTIVNKGSSASITIYPAWSASVYSEGYAVWIDYNIDGDFADAGELVFSKAASTATSATGTFTIPTTATTGTTRMRVSMKYNGIPTSCESFSYGEVEDYSIEISAAKSFQSGIITNTEVKATVYPNPATSYVYVEFKSNQSENATLRIIGVDGKLAISETIAIQEDVNKFKLDVSNLNNGVYQLILIGNTTKVSSTILVKK